MRIIQGILPVTNEMAKPKINKIDKIIFFICTIDILFFPYIRIASASLSMILLPLWYIFNLRKIKVTKEFALFVVLSLIVIFSVMFSFLNFPGASFLNSNIVYSTILIYGFLYYFFYRFFFDNSDFPLTKILNTYTIFGFALATVYLISPSLYFFVRSFWTMSGNVIEVENGLSIHRFTSTFSDPNNAAVAFVAVLAFLLFNSKQSAFKNLLLIAMTGVIVSATMSSTGFILYGTTLAFLLLKGIFRKNPFVFRKSTVLYVILIILISPLLFLVANSFFDSQTFQVAMDRVIGNSMDSRTDIWRTLLANENIFEHILIGTGGTVLVSGIPYSPHNGHLHLIYSYGMIAYVTFLIIFFRKRKKTSLASYFFILILLLGFTVNVGIYEIRFVTIMALLVASYGALSWRNQQKANKVSQEG